MTWKTTNQQREKELMMEAYGKEEATVTELAQRHGISRKTVYKWISRYEEEGWKGLTERPRAPRHHPNALSEEMEALVLECKARWPRWGAPKLVIKLRERVGAEECPSESSVSRILQRHGLVKPQGRRRARAQGTELEDYGESNAIWCADFKGWWKLGNGKKCTPLTISDGASRMLLRCQGLGAKTGGRVVRPIFEATMREYGVPGAMRTDNGPPFASVGLGGLTELSIWWLRLGIRLERSRPGCPQDNGRHERMHRTLEAETARPLQANLVAQQRAFDQFRRQYNEERPHEGLEGRTPAQVYEPSSRDFPERLLEIEYPSGWLTRRVRPSGQIKWQGQNIHVNRALAGERIGFEPAGDGAWLVHFATHPLGVFEERTRRIEPLRKSPRRRR